MKNWFGTLSLRTKAIGVILVLFIATLGTVGSIMIWLTNGLIVEEQRRTAKAMATSLARSCELPLSVEDHAELKRLAGRFYSDKDVRFVVVFNDAAEEILHLSRDKSISGNYKLEVPFEGQGVIVSQQRVEELEAIGIEDIGELGTLGESDVKGLDLDEQNSDGATKSVGWVVVGMSTDSMRRAQRAQATATVLIFAAAAGVSTILILVFIGSWIERLYKLVAASEFLSRGDFTVEVKDEDSDEIGHLTQSFDNMRIAIRDQNEELRKRQLELEEEISERRRIEKERAELQQELVESSHKAGMAEVATGVLHNVGNVLNSINVSTTQIVERMRESRIGDLAAVAGMVKEHESELADFVANDPRGKHLATFLAAISDHMVEGNDLMVDKLGSLTKNIDHIKQIVSMQQSYAKTVGTSEVLRLTELMDDAIRMNEASLERHNVELELDYEEVQPMLLDRHKIMQIFINAISNAKYAMDDLPDIQSLMKIRVFYPTEDTIRVEIVDNGKGIKKEELERVFEHGFTTRKKGHGFGLHSSALSAKQLGGLLWLESEGIGKGATLVLELPISRNELTEEELIKEAIG